jgi:hypothetical protein
MIICALPWSKALNEGDVELDFRLQLQTDPFLMPIENNGVLWPEKLSPRGISSNASAAETEVRFAGANGICQEALLQPLAYHRRASSAG